MDREDRKTGAVVVGALVLVAVTLAVFYYFLSAKIASHTHANVLQQIVHREPMAAAPQTLTPETAVHPLADGTLSLFDIDGIEAAKEGYGSVVLVDILFAVRVSNGDTASTLLAPGDEAGVVVLVDGSRRHSWTRFDAKAGLLMVHYKDTLKLLPQGTKRDHTVTLNLSGLTAASALTTKSNVWISPVFNSLLQFVYRM